MSFDLDGLLSDRNTELIAQTAACRDNELILAIARNRCEVAVDDRLIAHRDSSRRDDNALGVLKPNALVLSIWVDREVLTGNEKANYYVKFNLEGLLRGDYQSRMNGYAIGRQNGWMSANDIREFENLDRIPAEDGGDLYLINGNMLPLCDAGAFANTPTLNRKENEPDEEILEMDESGADGELSGGENAVSQRHHRRGKLVR